MQLCHGDEDNGGCVQAGQHPRNVSRTLHDDPWM
jgi:hypothetical protein